MGKDVQIDDRATVSDLCPLPTTVRGMWPFILSLLSFKTPCGWLRKGEVGETWGVQLSQGLAK